MKTPMKKNADNRRTAEGGYILVLLLIIGTLIFILVISSLFAMKNSVKTAGATRNHDAAFNLAEAGKEHGLAWLRAGGDTLFKGPIATYRNIFKNVKIDSLDTSGCYSVQSMYNTTQDTITMQATGKVGGDSVTIEASFLRYSTFLSRFKAVLNTASKDSIIDSMTVSGDDLDTTKVTINGATPNSAIFAVEAGGIFGVYSFDTCFLNLTGKLPKIYGNGNPYPALSGWSVGSLIQSKDTANFPHTPEEVTGLSVGAFNSFKWIGTIPSSIILKDSIFYATKSPSIGLTLSGTGVFICHNDSNTATLTMMHGGPFRGLIIADRIDQLSATMKIIGAAYTISNNLRSQKSTVYWNRFGFNNASMTPMIHYCSQALKNSEKVITTKLSNVNYYKVDVLSWKEL